MIYIVNNDEPGFIGALGTKLGENRINIATFNLGRHEAGGEAVALVSVDDPITAGRGRRAPCCPGRARGRSAELLDDTKRAPRRSALGPVRLRASGPD